MKRTGQQALIGAPLLFICPFANMDTSLIGLSVTAMARDFRLQPSQTGLT